MPSKITDICDDLRAQGISGNSVHRMYSTRAQKRQLPLFLVKAKRGDDKIYKVTRCLDLIVRVEKQLDSTATARLIARCR